uniref:WGS project CAEQ00000000 data, annotated contig 1726 n=1 Tax=Trypanosoma congolense (strain IL3000) TaxID=1068625 RepID=F9W8C0_TRYCI|nr:unnamed protein product [Trypanosoma congolense IL3000]
MPIPLTDPLYPLPRASPSFSSHIRNIFRSKSKGTISVALQQLPSLFSYFYHQPHVALLDPQRTIQRKSEICICLYKSGRQQVLRHQTDIHSGHRKQNKKEKQIKATKDYLFLLHSHIHQTSGNSSIRLSFLSPPRSSIYTLIPCEGHSSPCAAPTRRRHRSADTLYKRKKEKRKKKRKQGENKNTKLETKSMSKFTITYPTSYPSHPLLLHCGIVILFIAHHFRMKKEAKDSLVVCPDMAG